MWGQVAANIMKGTLKLLGQITTSPFLQCPVLRSQVSSLFRRLCTLLLHFAFPIPNPKSLPLFRSQPSIQSNPIPFAFRLPVPYTSIPIPILSYLPLACSLFLQQSNTQTLNICPLLLQSSAAAATKLKGAIGSNRNRVYNDSTWEQCLD